MYENGVASTVHSYYGLGAADRPAEQVIQYAFSNNIVCEKIRSLNVLIWDEASMSSARVFEIVNAIHHNLSNDELLDILPFAGTNRCSRRLFTVTTRTQLFRFRGFYVSFESFRACHHT